MCCFHGEFPVELEGQMSAFNHCLHEAIGHDSSQLLGMVVPWRLSSVTPSPSIALALHTFAPAFIHEFSLSLLPLPPSYLPKMCQLQNKGIITGAVWLASCGAQQLNAALAEAALSVCSISHLHSCVCLLFHRSYTQAVISSFYGCLQLNSLLILTWQKLKRLHIINR